MMDRKDAGGVDTALGVNCAGETRDINRAAVQRNKRTDSEQFRNKIAAREWRSEVERIGGRLPLVRRLRC